MCQYLSGVTSACPAAKLLCHAAGLCLWVCSSIFLKLGFCCVRTCVRNMEQPIDLVLSEAVFLRVNPTVEGLKQFKK